MNAVWYLDSGATNHVIANAFDIQHQDSTPLANGVLIANGNEILVLNSDYFSLCVCQNQLKLDNIIHVLEVKKN